MMAEINLQTDAQEFLFYSYFGVPYAGTKKEEMKVACFKRAYRDFCRTITINDDELKRETEKRPKEKVTFASDVFNGIGEEKGQKLSPLLDKIVCKSEFKKDEDFYEVHEEICEAIKCNAEKVPYWTSKGSNERKFYYGQAQKWVNMTLKYMRMTGLWKDEFLKIDSFLHIPLDSYILKALFREDLRVEINKETPNLIDEDTDLIRWIQEKVKAYKKLHNGVDSDGAFVAKVVDSYPEFKKGKVEPVTWSKIGAYGAYVKIQDAVKACIPNDPKTGKKFSPLDWENKIWLAEAEAEAKFRKEKSDP